MSTSDPRHEALLWLALWRDLGVEELPIATKRKRPESAQPAEPAVETAPPVTEHVAPPAGEAALDDPAAALEHLRTSVIGDCRRCRLSEGRTNIVFGVGDPRARLMFVGEGPGADEDVKGEPFVGRAGQLLDRIILAMGLTRAEVYIGNVVKCRPPENRAPLPDESETCRVFLERQIRIIQPEVIVALGKTALEGLTGSPVASISRHRGQWWSYQGIPLMVTFHPAYLLRNPSAKRPVWEDMQQVMTRLGMPLPARDAGE